MLWRTSRWVWAAAAAAETAAMAGSRENILLEIMSVPLVTVLVLFSWLLKLRAILRGFRESGIHGSAFQSPNHGARINFHDGDLEMRLVLGCRHHCNLFLR